MAELHQPPAVGRMDQGAPERANHVTGLGKTWLACALSNQACRQGYSSLYVRVPRLFEELSIAHGDGRYVKLITQLAKVDVLLLDDWGVASVRKHLLLV